MLCFYLSDIWDGAWLPDTLIRDMSYGHIFKMDSDSSLLGQDISNESWLITPYPELKTKLGSKRLCLELVKDSPELAKPYRSHPKIGGDLPNRVIAISHSISDMLKMADYPLAFYAKKQLPEEYKTDLSSRTVKDLSGSPNFSARQIALNFFILSHYITDAHMPLHCDLRDYGTPATETSAGTTVEGKPLRRIPPTLHASIEEEWEKHMPEKSMLMMEKYSKQTLDGAVSGFPKDSIIKIDPPVSLSPNSSVGDLPVFSKYSLGKTVPSCTCDEWQEMVYICRTSYALSRTWITDQYPDAKTLIAAKGADEFSNISNAIFHDAVITIASLWLKSWKKFTG